MKRWTIGRWRLVLLAAALLSMDQVSAADVDVGIFIGSNVASAPGDAPLQWSDYDAVRAAAALGSGLPKGRRRVLITPGQGTTAGAPVDGSPASEPTLESVAAAFADLTLILAQSRQAEPELRRRFTFYYSGHGGGGLHLIDGLLPWELLQVYLEGAAAQADEVLVVVDACESARVVKGETTGEPAQVEIDLSTRALADAGWVVSEGATEERSDLIRGGVLTHILMSALGGAADANVDEKVTFAEAAAYADFYNRAQGTKGSGGITVRPPRRGGDQAVIVDRTGAARTGFTLTGTPGRDAEECWVIRDTARGALVQELCRRQSEPRHIWLPPGRYQMMRYEVGALFGVEGEVVLGERNAVDLSAADLDGSWAWVIKDADLAARRLSVAEQLHLSTTPLRRAPDWRAYDLGRTAFSVEAGTYIPVLRMRDEISTPDSITSEALSAVLLGAADLRLGALPLRSLWIGVGLDAGLSPDTAVDGPERDDTVAWVLATARLSYKARVGPTSVRASLAVGDMVGGGIGSDAERSWVFNAAIPTARLGVSASAISVGPLSVALSAGWQVSSEMLQLDGRARLQPVRGGAILSGGVRW